MQENDCTTYPQVGWPQALPLFLKEEIKIKNFAKNGRSTKSFIDEGRFKEALNEVEKGDYCLIEFGHNDEKINDQTRYTDFKTTYKDNLKFFIDEVIKKGGNPLILSPIYRRCFTNPNHLDEKCHKGYHEACLKVAEEKDVPFVDLTHLTKIYLEKIGVDASRNLFMNFDAGIYDNYPDGKADNTHLRMDGAFVISKLFVEEVKRKNLEMKELFK